MTDPSEFIPLVMRVELPSKNWSCVLGPPRVLAILAANPDWTMEEGCAALFGSDDPWTIESSTAVHDGTKEILYWTLKPTRVH